jgi:hypothetical protein
MESLCTPCYTEKSWHHFSLPLLAPNLHAYQLTEETGEQHAPCWSPLIHPNKTEKQTANCTQTQTVEVYQSVSGAEHTLEKRVKAKN